LSFMLQLQLKVNYLNITIKFNLAKLPNDNAVRLSSNSVHLFNSNLINFIVDIQARQVHSISRNHVNQVISTAIFSEQNLKNKCEKGQRKNNVLTNLSIEDFVLVQDQLNQFLINPSQVACCVERKTTTFFDLKQNYH
jgi:hypothetical protein